jgi:glycosyltransferase involved in cell wall biosynthesis
VITSSGTIACASEPVPTPVVRPVRALKILFVTNMYPAARNQAWGAFVWQQAEHLRRVGHHVDVLHVEGAKSRLRYVTSGWDVFSRTHKEAYDIVHAHYGLSGVPALFRWRTPLVVTLHGSDVLVGRVQPLISRAVAAFADAVIAVSPEICEKIPGELIPCGVDVNLFKPRDRTAARVRLGLTQRAKLVLFPFDPARRVKRVHLARQAVERLGLGVELLIVSGVANAEMPWYYSAADAMILCSESEGSPTSIKEALACNLPIISTDVGDVREIMSGIEGCEIVEADADALARGLERILGRQRSTPFDGRSRIMRYDQRHIIASIVRVYERIAER